MALPLLLAAAPQTAVDAERAFAADAQTMGQWTAFRKWAAPDATLFLPAVRAHEFLKDRKDPQVGYMWWPAQAFVSCDGNTAVTTGPSIRGATRGYFTTVWKRQVDGGWKWVFDHGDELAEARPAGEAARERRASCADTPPPPGSSTGADRDRAEPSRPADDHTLRWYWTLEPTGRKQVVVTLWNGTEHEEVLRDVIAAEPK